MGDPFVKLLPLIDPSEASGDFARIRGSKPRTNITYNVVSSDAMGAASDGVSASQVTLDKLDTLIPIMLCVMGLNALILLALVALTIVYICRKKQSRVARRAKRQSILSLPMGSMNNTGGTEPPHQYEPVMKDEKQSPSVHSFHPTDSMLRPQSSRPVSTAYPQSLVGIPETVNDDPFRAPPSPFQMRMRPHSSYQPTNTQSAHVNVYPPVPRSTPTDDESFAPPSPGFLRHEFPSGSRDNLISGNAEGLRPNSIA